MSKAKPIKLPQTNSQGKKVGADNKACWPGYRYQGTVKGKDVCTKVKKQEYKMYNKTKPKTKPKPKR